MVDLNVSNLQIGDDGRISFSGLGSGIDFEAAVDGIIAAKRIPVDRLETKIETNQAKIDSIGITRTLTTALQESLQDLHGAVTFDNSGSIFNAKQAFASASRTDGASPSTPTNILGVSVGSDADPGNHTIEVLQTARAHRVGSGSFSSTTADLGTARGLAANSISGDIEIAGVTIAVLATDSMNDLADRINAANSGATPTGVSASVVSTSESSSFLVLTVDETGQTLGDDISISDPDDVLENLGVLAASGNFANQLQAARKAQIHADGLLDSTSHSSTAQNSSSIALGVAGTLSFSDSTGAAIGDLSYLASDSLDDIADAIANDAALSSAGITATIVSDDDGFSLQITGSDAFDVFDSSTLLSDIGLTKDPLVIERDSNTISDLFDGVTLTLFQAEVGTTINIDIERDLTSVKTGLVNFVTAYNNLRQELNFQLNVDPDTGEANEEATLFGNSALEEIDRRLEDILGSGADGSSGAFSVLAQIGIDFVANGELQDQTLRDTLEINEETLDAALLNDPDSVRDLFEFSFSSSDPRVVLLGFDGSTTHTEDGYTVDLDYDEVGGALNAATLDDGTATVNGQNITVNSGGAKGLKLFYSGDTDLSGISIDFSVGIGAKMFFELDEILDTSEGLITTEVDNLTDQNDLAQERADAMIERLERERESQLNQFIRMETALSSMNQLLDQITQITEAMFQDR